MYLGLSALSYRLVPRAGSPACPGLAALGPEKYTRRTALGTKMYPGQAAPGTWGMDIFVCFALWIVFDFDKNVINTLQSIKCQKYLIPVQNVEIVPLYKLRKCCLATENTQFKLS